MCVFKIVFLNRKVLKCMMYINLYRNIHVFHGIILFLSRVKISSLSKTENPGEVTQKVKTVNLHWNLATK